MSRLMNCLAAKCLFWKGRIAEMIYVMGGLLLSLDGRFENDNNMNCLIQFNFDPKHF